MSEMHPALTDVLNDLPPEQQQAVYEFALSLQQSASGDAVGTVGKRFYICPVCFATAEQPIICHEHLMMPCQANSPEDCRPQMDKAGYAQTRAPRWFTQAVYRLRLR